MLDGATITLTASITVGSGVTTAPANPATRARKGLGAIVPNRFPKKLQYDIQHWLLIKPTISITE